LDFDWIVKPVFPVLKQNLAVRQPATIL